MTEAERATIAVHPVLLYDGVCALCNGVVQFVLRHDHAGVFVFAAIESDVARELLGPLASVQDGVAVVTGAGSAGQKIFRRSEAVLEALRLLQWRRSRWLLALMPRWLREMGYAVVARLRYRLFGQYKVCPLPSTSVRSRFLGL